METQASPSFPPRIIKCPACGFDTRYAAENPYRPFCSARCKGHDFGAWANENFRVLVQNPQEAQDPLEPSF